MSYSIDRSARTRGVNAIAARDLQGDDGGGAVVRTGRGPVVIVSRHEGLGGFSARNPYRNQLPWQRAKALQWEKDHAPRSHIGKSRRKVRPQINVKVRRPFGPGPKKGFGAKYIPVPGMLLAPTSHPAPPSSPSSSFTGGGGGGGTWGGGGGGGGSTWGGGGGGGGGGGAEYDPSSEASIREQEAALEAATPDAGPGAPAPDAAEKPAAKAPMSSGMKIGVALAAGLALFSMFGKH
jgi:hypothetical protein